MRGHKDSREAGDGASEPDVPAVAYVRMSTDHQKYSTENQLDVIRSYAATRGLQILRVFEDSGRSGLRLDGREALQNLMAEVQSGKADFKAILAYDVSRWGRFQDADEGAYHEHVCSRAGCITAASNSRTMAASARTS
jgi:DNA invertase Pin-like site-specific DNA recombinase